ncbi:MAG: ABC-2 family transporter protein [Rhizobiaceae bacterium]|nr:ABC-2 family transporter protein [Rhizobiaceae bacterium]
MLRTIAMLVTMQMRSQMEYRAAFFVDRVAQMIAYGAAFAAIWILLERFGDLGGWHWPEIALLLSIQLLAYSVGSALSFVQFRDFEELVRRGTLDSLLVKPFSPWAYIAFSGLNVGYAGHIALGAGLLVWALGAVDVAPGVANLAYLAGAMVSASMFFAALLTIIGASAMVFVQSGYLYSVFFGLWELTRYPLHIYPAPLQGLLIAVIPLAFGSYVPAAVYLGEPVPFLGPLAGPVSLAVGPVAALLARFVWQRMLAGYQGAGG